MKNALWNWGWVVPVRCVLILPLALGVMVLVPLGVAIERVADWLDEKVENLSESLPGWED